MNNNKKNIIILIVLFIILVVVGIIFFVDFSSSNSNEKLNINKINNGDINDKNTEDIINNSSDNSVSIEKEIDNIHSEYKDNNNLMEEKNEEEIISYFENIEYEVKNSKSFNEKIKEYFIAIVDFIFYGGEVNGYTFDRLTSVTKAKIIAIALKMDTKIEEYVPGYKESISSATGKMYVNIKEKLITSYMEISCDVCKNNEEECNKVKDIFSDVKDYCKIGWDFIKGLFKNGITKIKDWYEIYSGK